MTKKTKTDHKTEINKLQNQLARALADYDNLQKRVEKQKDILESTLNLRLIARMLLILDMLIEVQGHVDDPGLAITITEFRRVLADEGVKEIEANKEENFDENMHEAVEKVKTNKNELEGKIAEVVQAGWIKNEKLVVRPARVKVYGK